MRKIGMIIGLTALAAAPALAADPAKIDWSKIPVANVTLFYPGQSSYEWLRRSGHPGANPFWGARPASGATQARKRRRRQERQGRAAGANAGQRQERHRGSKVQAAYDDKNAYLRFQWKTRTRIPGTEHQYLRFDGKEWKVYGYPSSTRWCRRASSPASTKTA